MDHLKGLARDIALPIAIIGVYALVSTWLASVYMPPPSDIGGALVDWLSERFRADVLLSVKNLFVGFTIGSLAGATVGIMVGLNRTLAALVLPVATFIRGIPPIALIPAFMIALGIGSGMRMALIATGCFFPVFLSAAQGAAGLDPVLKDVARTNHLTRRQRIFRVIVPGALPEILSGMRVALTIAVILIFTSEVRGATDGIGAFILTSERFFNLPGLWAGILFLGFLGYVLAKVFEAIERRLISWREV